jgi:hypothetical protein
LHNAYKKAQPVLPSVNEEELKKQFPVTFLHYIMMLVKCYDPDNPEFGLSDSAGFHVDVEWLDPVSGFERFLIQMGAHPDDRKRLH